MEFGVFCFGWAAKTCSAHHRWKQHEAYVQVLEAKYAELCCKYTCYKTRLWFNLVSISTITMFLPGAAVCGSQWKELTWYVLHFCTAFIASANDVPGLKESEEKLKQQQQESARRENILVMRLATKEQEMQECTVCIYSSHFDYAWHDWIGFSFYLSRSLSTYFLGILSPSNIMFKWSFFH